MRAALRALLLALAITTAPAHAGRNCEARLPDTRSVQRAMDLAAATARALDASGASVVVLGRAGQDLAKYRLRWSHIALAYKESTASGTQWRVVHKLNHCGSAQADLYRQGLGEFFMDDLFDHQAAIAVLAPEVQARLLPLLPNNFSMQRLHTPAYSMVAYPWSQTYQQSNQWAIETLALSQEPTITSRERAQAWLLFKGYTPTVLRIPPLTRLGARMTASNIAFDDHPGDKRYSDRIETVTADSVFDWLERSGLAATVQVVR